MAPGDWDSDYGTTIRCEKNAVFLDNRHIRSAGCRGPMRFDRADSARMLDALAVWKRVAPRLGEFRSRGTAGVGVTSCRYYPPAGPGRPRELSYKEYRALGTQMKHARGIVRGVARRAIIYRGGKKTGESYQLRSDLSVDINRSDIKICKGRNTQVLECRDIPELEAAIRILLDRPAAPARPHIPIRIFLSAKY